MTRTIVRNLDEIDPDKAYWFYFGHSYAMPFRGRLDSIRRRGRSRSLLTHN